MNDFTNRTFDEIEVGTSASVSRTLTATDVEALAAVLAEVEAMARNDAGSPGAGAG